MATQYVYEFTVEGKMPFPIDMLRYDAAFPKTELDSSVITSTFRRGGGTIVNLCSHTKLPTDGRWESFGWKVISRSKRKI